MKFKVFPLKVCFFLWCLPSDKKKKFLLSFFWSEGRKISSIKLRGISYKTWEECEKSTHIHTHKLNRQFFNLSPHLSSSSLVSLYPLSFCANILSVKTFFLLTLEYFFKIFLIPFYPVKSKTNTKWMETLLKFFLH